MLSPVEIDNLASVGLILDEPPYQLPPEAWSTATNMRMFADGLERVGGWSQVFGSGALAQGPQFSMYVASATQPWWLWTSLTDAFVWDGVSTNFNITRAAGVYNASDAKSWNGTVLGGIPILNNGIDVPQYWALPYNTGTKLAALPNFPAGTTCRVMRAFLNFLIAINITAAGTNTPHLILWSTEAVPGTFPASWNVADPTQDAGNVDVTSQSSGLCLDGLELNGRFYIYKENSIHRMTFIGGRFIFDFKTYVDTTGLLATRCVAVTGDGTRHVFASQDDILVHNGANPPESILNRRQKRTLFNAIDPTRYDVSFMWSNPLFEEVWFCYPEVGQLKPSRALIWNYRYNAITEADGIDFSSAAIGNIPSPSGRTWTQATQTWAADPDPWAASLRRKVVITNPTTKKLHLFDNTITRDGVSFTGTLQRTALGLVGRKRDGSPIEDFEIMKLVDAVWPKITGNNPVSIRVGYQQLPNGSVTWGAVQAFDPTTMTFVGGVQGTGRAIAVEFSASNFFHLDGYKMDMTTLGKF